ncbi:MAG: TIGR03960 family B12-binding radical SAM protein [Halanaerobiaceae bacterium]
MELKKKLDRILYRVSNPERYTGNEWNMICPEWTEEKIKVVLGFPDVYEIGMSHLGIKILYHKLNQEEDILCERAFAPWPDMETLLEEEGLPLFSLESKRPLREFDILGFTLQYEMSYTNILSILALGDIPLVSEERGEGDPLVIAGGATVYNPEPLADFIDLFFIGEAEEGIVELVRGYNRCCQQAMERKDILRKLAKMPGVYVPSLYDVTYQDGEVVSIVSSAGVKERINRQLVKDLDKAFYPVDFIVPYMDVVHDRAVVEISRGCTRGCRFCAAGMNYRPVRERSRETVLELTDKILESTGYEEISLSSLSTVDYTGIDSLVRELMDRYGDRKISISLSSLRVDEFSVRMAEEVQRVRKTGLTFAPEAGTQRLRDVINKGVNEEQLYRAVEAAFSSGWHRIKLYFMIGLPTETRQDLEGIVRIARRVLEKGKEIRRNSDRRMKRIQVSVSVSTFIPKPFTPFQWVRMSDREEIKEKQSFLRENLRAKGLKLSWDKFQLSLLEGVFARGDRRLGSVLKTAFEKGARFDGWKEHFDFDLWLSAFREHGLDLEDYTGERDLDAVLPWGHISSGVSREFLLRELGRAREGELTADCREAGCSGCGLSSRTGMEVCLSGYEE